MKINRRELLRTGIFTAASAALSPYLSGGTFGNRPILLDDYGRIYYSPMLREYRVDHAPELRSMIRMGANENPYGPPESAKEAIVAALKAGGGNRYSGQELSVLVEKIARKEGVSSQEILMGPGSTDLLERTAMVLCAGGGNVVSGDPTYMSLIRTSEAVGATWKAIPSKSDWSLDLAAMERAVDRNTKLVYVCNPNNPVGTVVNINELRDFCKRVSARVPVFVDEAYLDFAGAAAETMVGLVAENKNVIISRTFSKVMGMAGIRMGYLVGLKSTLDLIRRISSGSMGISLTSTAAAIAAFEDTAFQKMTVAKNEEVKQYLCASLKSLGISYIPSYTNFVIFPIAKEGREFLGMMNDRGIAVRAFEIQGKPWCRVSMGTMEEMKQFVSSLKIVT